jgi:hypothetical protein
MATTGDFITRINPFGSGGGLIDLIIAISIGTIAIGIIAWLIYYFVKKKINYDLKVEFRLPRNLQRIKDENGNEKMTGTIRKEWGKGYYDAKKGIVYIKRKRKTPIPMKPFNIKEFLSDNNILTVLQVGVEDYRPVLEDSYLEVVDYDSGEEGALIKAKIDTSESKTWKNSYERERKATYTISGWLQEHGQLLGFGFILICIFVGFAIVYGKIAP